MSDLMDEALVNKDTPVRIFPVYAPRLIAKHAKIFREGMVMVQEDQLGEIEFREGRFVMPRTCSQRMKKVILELNQLLLESMPRS